MWPRVLIVLQISLSLRAILVVAQDDFLGKFLDSSWSYKWAYVFDTIKYYYAYRGGILQKDNESKSHEVPKYHVFYQFKLFMHSIRSIKPLSATHVPPIHGFDVAYTYIYLLQSTHEININNRFHYENQWLERKTHTAEKVEKCFQRPIPCYLTCSIVYNDTQHTHLMYMYVIDSYWLHQGLTISVIIVFIP